MFFNCNETSSRQLYALLIGLVTPRPIAWVSTTSKEGIDNLAPFSFFNLFGVNPPVVGFSPGYKRPSDGGKEPVMKDSLRNVIDTKEFVVNIVNEALMDQMNASSADLPPAKSEFDYASLTRAQSSLVKPPRVADAPAALECKLLQTLPLGGSTLVLGEIVCVHVRDELWEPAGIRSDLLRPVGRLGKDEYLTMRGIVELDRP